MSVTGGAQAVYTSIWAAASLLAYISSVYGVSGAVTPASSEIFYLSAGVVYSWRAAGQLAATITSSSMSIEFISS